MRWPVVSESWTARPARVGEGDLFEALDGRPFALLHGEGRFQVLARDPLAVGRDLDLTGLAFSRRGDLPPILPDLIGFVGYEMGYALEPLAGQPAPPPMAFPDCHLALHAEVLILDRAEGRLYTGRREAPRQIEPCPNLLRPGAFSARRIANSDTAASFGAKVARIREEIARGNVYQVNLTRQETWAWEGNLGTFARRLATANAAPHSAFLAGPDWAVVSSSPETLLRIQEGRLITRPIKGTAPRGQDPTADHRLAEELLASPKNRAELAMIVDLLRNDLTRACRLPSVRVDAFPELESYANVHHLVATVSGELRPGLDLRELFAALFPGGSVTGCPKLAAMRLIRDLEPLPRSVYTGALGWLRSDLQQADLALAIRTAWAVPGELRFGLGGGITWDSDPADEYEETVHKGRSIVQCLS